MATATPHPVAMTIQPEFRLCSIQDDVGDDAVAEKHEDHRADRFRKE
jgi:hypothetical protein